jgi:excisionase family DNA binding protein
MVAFLEELLRAAERGAAEGAERAVRLELRKAGLAIGAPEGPVPKMGFSFSEAAEYTGLSESSLRRAAKRGELAVKDVGGRRVITRSELDRLLRG